MKKLPAILFCLLALGLGIMLWSKDTPKPAGDEENRKFPDITVTTLDETYRWNPEILADHVTVVNFFASWCTPCAAEMPELMALKKQFPMVKFQGIAWNDKPETLKKWLATHGNPFTHVWLDKKGDATIDLGIKGIPETFIIDKTGTIRYHLTGPLTEDLRNNEFGGTIKALLGGTIEAPPQNASIEVPSPESMEQSDPMIDSAIPKEAAIAAPALLAPTKSTKKKLTKEEKRVQQESEKARKEHMRRLKSPMLVGSGKHRRNH
jgi:cytochrome c biogenesis protein CcmG/thiol:disulfide interchange protein DsbE